MRAYAVVGVRRALPVGQLLVGHGIAERHEDRRRRIIEETGIPEIPAALSPDFPACQQGMTDATACDDARDISLIEHIQPRRGVVVGRERHARPVLGRGAGDVVLISTVVIAGDGAIANREAAGVVLDAGSGDVDIRTDVAVRNIADEGRHRKISGTPAV